MNIILNQVDITVVSSVIAKLFKTYKSCDILVVHVIVRQMLNGAMKNGISNVSIVQTNSLVELLNVIKVLIPFIIVF